jgi:hypothetical protein
VSCGCEGKFLIYPRGLAPPLDIDYKQAMLITLDIIEQALTTGHMNTLDDVDDLPCWSSSDDVHLGQMSATREQIQILGRLVHRV